METLKIKGRQIKQLKEEHGVDLLSGAQLDNIDALAAIYSVGSQHWAQPLSVDDVLDNIDLADLTEAITAILDPKAGKKRGAK